MQDVFCVLYEDVQPEKEKEALVTLVRLCAKRADEIFGKACSTKKVAKEGGIHEYEKEKYNEQFGQRKTD
jgi:hypothetical protein